MSNYDELHRQCRTLENLFDAKLTSYAQVASNIVRPSHDLEAAHSAERWNDLEAELDDLSLKARPFSPLTCSFMLPSSHAASFKKSTINLQH